MEHQRTIISASLQETEKAAKETLSGLLKQRVIILQGNLGSGKTAFVKAVAKALKITENITSPTYNYTNSYKIPSSNSSLLTLKHFDLYRLPEHSQNTDQISAEISLDQALKNPHNLVMIEWPERLNLNWGKHMAITCEKEENSHKFSFKSFPKGI